MTEKQKTYLFDFDGTLTKGDTLVAFIRYAKGWRRLIAGFLIFSPWIALMMLHIYNNGRCKERLFRWFFGGMSERDFNETCKRFAKDNARMIRPMALKTICAANDDENPVFVVTASVGNWVRAMLDNYDIDVTVVATELEIKDGHVTGFFSTPNCYGEEKVRRLETLITDREKRYIIAFGDSKGDQPMMDFADESHYKPFRNE